MAPRLTARLARPRRAADVVFAAAGAVALGIAFLAVIASLGGAAIPGASAYARVLIVLLLAAAACGLLVAAYAVESPGATVWAAAALGSAWLVAIAGGSPWGSLTPFVAGLLLVAAELAHWSFDLRPGGLDEPGIRRSRAIAIALLCVGATGLAVLPLAAAAPGPLGGEDLAILATAALVCAVSVAALGARAVRAP